MGAMHFVSRDTGHALVRGYGRKDFKWWYDHEKDRITPLLNATFQSSSMKPVLLSGNTDENGRWGPALAAATISHGKGEVIVCQVQLDSHTKGNPVARNFAKRILHYGE